MSPVFEAADDGQELLVINIIVPFCWVECLGVVSHWPLLPCPFVFLVQDCSSVKGQSVNFQDELFEGVRLVEDGVVKGDVDQFFDGFAVCVCP